MKKIFILLLFSVAVFGANAQTLSLEECVQIAIENNLDVKNANLSEQDAQYDYLQSKRNLLPSLNGSTSHSLNFGRSLDQTTYQFNTNTTQGNSFGVSANALLFNGLRMQETIKLQEMLKNRSETSTKGIKDQIAITVASNYMAAVVAKEQIGTAKNQFNQRKIDLERNEKLIQEGAIAGSTRYDFEAQMIDAEYQVQQAENNYEVNLLRLKQVMQMPFTEPLDVQFPSIDTPSIDYLRSNLNPDIVYQNALITQGVIQGAEQDISIAEKQIKIVKAQKIPTISLGGGVNTYTSSEGKKIKLIQGIPTPEDSPFAQQFSDNLSQNLGLSVSIPIFNKGQVNNQIKKAKVAVERSVVNAQKQQQQLEQTIQSAYLDAELAYKNYQVAKKRVESLTKTTEFAKRRYDIGSASIYDYLNNQNSLANAELTMTQAKYDYIYKVNILEFYKENKFEF